MAPPKKQRANSQYTPIFVRLKLFRSQDRIQISRTRPGIYSLSETANITPNYKDRIQGTQPTASIGSSPYLSVDMSWYNEWLSQQLENLPYCLRELNVGGEKLQTKQSLTPLYEEVGDYVRKSDGASIDEILKHLQDAEFFDRQKDLMGAQRLLIFAILGWQSMLYQAAFNVCSVQELAIHEDSRQPQSGLVFDTYRVAADLSDRPLSILLKAFGNLLPARSSRSVQFASETQKMASTWHPLYPSETNAYLLHVLLHVHIQWVDSLCLHLDYDKSSRTLSLFRYPSFCLEMLRNHGIIYSFASIEGPCADPRANSDDISQYLLEVLLSYRLLFGQSASSRKFFRRTISPAQVQGCQLDTLLSQLCAKSRLDYSSSLTLVDRSVYFSARDFPVLYDRIELIAKELKDAKPKSFSGLIRDRRDTLQYWTFWLVSIIGGVSILLSLIQVILQGIQLLQS